jgi:arylformamidase
MTAPNTRASSWIDVSVPLEDRMIVWPGDPPFIRERVRTIAESGICNVTRLDMGAHTGTHVDAPIHFIEGAAGVDTTPIDALMGPAWVVDATSVEGAIDDMTIRGLDIPDDETRLLFKTTNGSLRSRGVFEPGFVALNGRGAEELVARRPLLVGLDFLSIAMFDDAVATHRALLGAGVVVVEGLDLRSVQPGPYELLCLPLLVVGCDGGPARALLRPRDA